ncbi:MAG TPA: M23 family metallopeptidase [Actinomycetota bacterium]
MIRRVTLVALVACLMACVVQAVPTMSSVVARGSGGCFNPEVPKSFQRQVTRAIRISRDLPIKWADSPVIAKIACWQGTDFRTGFRKRGGSNFVWHGMFAMTKEEVKTIFGTWMTADRNAYKLSLDCFVGGWNACPHTAANNAWAQQIIAGLRWVWLNYGTPAAAWGHIKRTGRFNSLPRQGTTDRPTRDPFVRCPVEGPLSYRDSFGERRTVGGYHPHWGNDVIAPSGRAIRAPFDGYAVPHSDNWFAGRWVTVVGEHGYVRNDHLSRFAKRGWVEAGDIVGYVGATGDATGPHDHFEWHPWALAMPLHRSPFGFTRVMDAIDPYPFLNRACRASRVPMPRRADRSLEG